MKKIYILAAAFYLLILQDEVSAQGIVINEILSSNTTINTDEDGSFQDWVELYNAGGIAVNLTGYGLSDEAGNSYKWVFPNVSVAPGAYLLIWCSDKNRIIPGSPLHTNFKISASGEPVSLTNASGIVVDAVPATVMSSDVSYGRQPNGLGSFVFYSNVTPNAANTGTGYSGLLSPPVFSHTGGFYSAAFSLILSTNEPGASIVYTVDGSEPSSENLSGTTYTYKNQYPELPGQTTGPLLNQTYTSLFYSTPINIVDRSPQANKLAAMSSTYSFNPAYYMPDNPIFKGTVVKAKVVKPGAMPSPTTTETYFVTPSGAARFTLPVISLSFSENLFFDYNEGIYVAGVDFDIWRIANPNLFPRGRSVGNYYRNGIENERRATMSYFVAGAEVIHQDVGLRIRGGSTRRYESKSLTVFARSDYGDETLSHQFFPNLGDNSFKRITLSNSGSDFKNTMFRDALAHEICKSLLVENENYQPAITFLNGEYWGILNVRERFDNEYFQRVYNIDEVDLLENRALEAEEGDTVHYDSMINFVGNNSLAVATNYEYIKTQLDPESFADYYIANIFFDNSDWPGNNTQFWRKRTSTYEPAAPYGHDGRWRWIFHDMDDSFSFGTDDFAHDNLSVATTVNNAFPNPQWSTLLLRKMLENSTFQQEFISRFADLMNTTFLSSRIISIMNTLKAGIAPEMAEHINRWSLPSSVTSWNNFIQYQANFANARPNFQRQHIRTKFGIASNINVTLNVSNPLHGHVKVNTIDIAAGTPGIASNPYPWTGIYFSAIPVRLKAIAKPGFIFSHWTGASTSTTAEITITSASSFAVTAVFVADGPIEISEPVYFWMMNGDIPNNQPLLTLNSTYELGSAASISYQSSLVGYPFTNASPNWRKASMERRNNPTPINYRPEANDGDVYLASTMKGLQITQPFQSGGLQNTMIFNLATPSYKDIKFSFAAVDEGAAIGITLDYSLNSGAPVWISSGLTTSAYALTSNYQLMQVDFSAISTVNNNPDFKIRLRFTGPNMTADTGKRVTFNNIALDGVKMPLVYSTPNVYLQGSAIMQLIPAISGGIPSSFSIAPSLPAGLTLNTTTGVISGTPTVSALQAVYTVTAVYTGGSATFDITLTVNPQAPGSLTYNTPNIFNVGTEITSLNPTVSGGTVASFTVLPSLPGGLSINSTTGVISGTPSAIIGTTTYTVTAANVSGNATFNISITINMAAPSELSYTTPNIFFTEQTITPLSPQVFGNVFSYNISPALSAGLNFNTVTGVISGMPAAPSGAVTYIITATNSGGSSSTNVVITVNESGPTTLSYSSPNTYTVGTAITQLNPTILGTVTSYNVNPALPSGLVLNTTTGVISGTPTVAAVTAGYTITATNSGGNTSFNIIITINDVPPFGFTYNSPNTFILQNAITSLSPSISGNNISFSIAPALPSGLIFDNATGTISGTPTSLSAMSVYTVTAINSGGSASFGIQIGVTEVPPLNLSYNTPNVYNVGTAITQLNPTVTGSVNTYSIVPTLPAGLFLNTATGIISGTPTVVASTVIYIVTASNFGGNDSFAISITVNDLAPQDLSYTSPNIFTVGFPITNIIPTVTGNVVSYSIFPALPSQLFFNTSTGVISGTPSVVAVTTHTVTAFNSGGSITFDVAIVINELAPAALSYSSPNIYTLGTAISSLTPSVTGNIDSYTVMPDLPPGLHLNVDTGIITGTPLVLMTIAAYTVTAINTGGFTTFDVVITVNAIAPSGLSYPSPSILTLSNSASIAPTVSGSVTSYSISPTLTSGLAFNTITGVISGTPTIIGTSAYTVTATNSGGSTSANINIVVNDNAPFALNYNSPNIFSIGTAISPLMPTVSGSVVSYSISPALPAGLEINVVTGQISGTPSALVTQGSYTVTAQNSGGSTSFDIIITVDNGAPIDLSYIASNVYFVGIEIMPLVPTVTGNVTSYNVVPILPAGLVFNTETGIISGIPTTQTYAGTYIITASNQVGSIDFSIIITVNDIAPSNLSYPSPNVLNVGVDAFMTANVTGLNVNYTIVPELPEGLQFNSSTGIISGTPTAITIMATYTITAQNTGGNTSFDIIIQVNDGAPTDLTYSSSNVFSVGSEITPLSPTVNGIVTSYSIVPSLPSGLLFDTATGVISGTPSIQTNTGTYVVTAVNLGGSTTFDIIITVNDIAPANLTYPSPNLFYVNTAATISPTITGLGVTYTIAPQLPDGLTFDSATGIVSGTPTVASLMTQYVVTAQNTGGNTTFEVLIAVTGSLTVDSNDLSNISVYPNPFSTMINIVGISNQSQYKIYSIEGKLIQEGDLDGTQIILRDLAEGMYVLHVIRGNKSMTRKIIKR